MACPSQPLSTTMIRYRSRGYVCSDSARRHPPRRSPCVRNGTMTETVGVSRTAAPHAGPPQGPVARETPLRVRRDTVNEFPFGGRAAGIGLHERLHHQDTKTRRRAGPNDAAALRTASWCLCVLVASRRAGLPCESVPGFVVDCPDVAVTLGVLTAFIGLMLSVSEGGGWHGPS